MCALVYMLIIKYSENTSGMKKASIDNVGSKSISSLTFSLVDEDQRQKRKEPMELSSMNFDVCHTCNDSKAMIFDAETNETC